MGKRTSPPISRDEDLAGPLPRELLDGWRTSSRSVSHAWEYLKPYLIEGTVLCGDGARLTALSFKLDPIELWARVVRMQRLIWHLATAAGARAPGGPWVADNFQVLFPPHAPVEFAIGVALEAHKRLKDDPNAIQIGCAIHRGHYYHLGDGLHGEDNALAEFISEECASGGETLVTRAALDALRPATKLSCARRTDLDHLESEVHRVVSGSVPVPLAMAGGGGTTFPLPFTRAFYDGLCAIDDPARWPDVRAELTKKHLVERSVVMAELAAKPPSRPYDILEAGMRDGKIAVSVGRLLSESGEVIGNFGGLVVATFPDPKDALDFAWKLGQALFEADQQVQIGIDRGPVIFVPGGTDEPWDAFGNAVFIASKLCNELGEPNRIHATDRALAGLTLPGPAARFSHVVSGVPLEGQVLDIGF
jgi:class 3 adenylate cyclase